MSNLYDKAGRLASAAVIVLVVLCVVVFTGIYLFVRELPFFR